MLNLLYLLSIERVETSVIRITLEMSTLSSVQNEKLCMCRCLSSAEGSHWCLSRVWL